MKKRESEKVCVCVSVWMCMCVWERERETERGRGYVDLAWEGSFPACVRCNDYILATEATSTSQTEWEFPECRRQKDKVSVTALMCQTLIFSTIWHQCEQWKLVLCFKGKFSKEYFKGVALTSVLWMECVQITQSGNRKHIQLFAQL